MLKDLFLVLMIFIFDIATTLKIIAVAKKTFFQLEEKIFSIFNFLGFLFALIYAIILENIACTILSILGFVLTEFMLAIIFYNKIKDKSEIYE